MKKMLLLLLLLSGFSFAHSADASCDVSSVNFSSIDTVESLEGQSTTITVNLTGCDEGIQIIPKETIRLPDGTFQAESKDVEIEIEDNPNNLYLPNGVQKIEVKYLLYEDGCFSNQAGFDCKYYVLVKHLGNTIWNGREKIEAISVQQEAEKNFQDGVLFASCGDDFFDVCDAFNNSWEFKSSNVQPKSFKECLLGDGDVSFTNTPFDEIGGETITLELKTDGKCTSIPIQVHLMSHEGGESSNSDFRIDIDPEFDGEDYIQLIAEEDSDVIIGFVGHDEECNAGKKPDCKIYVDIRSKNGKLIYSTRDFLLPISDNPPSGQALIEFNTNTNFKKGVFAADCDVFCGGKDWEWKTLIGGFGDDASTINKPEVLKPAKPQFDRESPCFKPELNNKKGGYDPNCYELLTPIPGIGQEHIVDGKPTGRWFIPSLRGFKLADYINTFFQVALGILMVLAVIAIVVAGVEYMTVESIYGKSEAKSRITSAVTGLVFALGIYTILNTINPNLLKIDFGEDIKSVLIDAGDGGIEPLGAAEFGISGTNKNCSEYATINQPDAINVKKFDVCKPIEQDVIDLLAAAKEDDIILTAYGARSRNRQITLRQQNCGTSNTDIYEKPPSQCSPPTAIPGTSWHESGYALDFQCVDVENGQEGAVNVHAGNINGTKKLWTQDCWDWLRNNAREYNFQNIPSENWHWNSSRRS